MKKSGFVVAKHMVKKVRRTHIGKNQNKILDILSKHSELTARDIAEILWARDIHYKTPEYSSTHRSLAALHQKGLVEKTDGKIKWRKTRMSRGKRALTIQAKPLSQR